METSRAGGGHSADRDLTPVIAALRAMRDGDWTTRAPEDLSGEAGELAGLLNSLADQQCRLQDELRRISREIGSEGIFGAQADVAGLNGSTKATVDEVNRMAASLTAQVRWIGESVAALANGDMREEHPTLPMPPGAGEIAEIQSEVANLRQYLVALLEEVAAAGRRAG